MKKIAVLILLYIILQIAVDKMLLSDDFIYDSLISQFAYDRISQILEQRQKWQLLAYLLIPLLTLIRILFVSTCLTIGSFFLRVEHGFGKLFSIATSADFIFLVPGIIKVVWFYVFSTDYTLSELQYFYPLSLVNFFSPTEVDIWFVYPLQLLNAFEILYWFVLALQLRVILQKDYGKSLGFVASTYGVGLLIWLVLTMFLTVTNS